MKNSSLKYIPRLFAFYLLLFTFLSCNGQVMIDNPTDEPDDEENAMTYLALGDSYTIGESVSIAERWPVQLQSYLNANKINFGEPRIIARTGWTTDELNQAIIAAKIETTYDLVSLLIGVNNQYRGRSAAQFRPEFIGLLNKAIQFAGGRKDRVFVVSIPDWGVTPFANGRDRNKIAKEIDAFNAVCKDEAEKAGVQYFDITPISRMALTDVGLVANDGLHPSGKMYTDWVALIGPVLKTQIK